jgi:SAM-dependent methyltransferase
VTDRASGEALPEHVGLNRAYWTGEAASYVASGRRNWAAAEPSWGIWGVPESEARLLPDVAGLDTIELGCGTAYVSAWLARRGARPVGVDITPAQLETARTLQREHGLEFPLIEASAEDVPLPDASFDLAISEYGAAIWCDPYRWIPEAARLLRPGGRLVFLGNSTLSMLCTTDDDTEDEPLREQLVRPFFGGLGRIAWSDGSSVEFNLGHGDMIRLLRASGFEVEDLVELRAPEGATTRYPYVPYAWARRWPCEEAWIARRRGSRPLRLPSAHHPSAAQGRTAPS